MHGCIPVIISEAFHGSFERSFPWGRIAVFIHRKDIVDIPDILRDTEAVEYQEGWKNEKFPGSARDGWGMNSQGKSEEDNDENSNEKSDANNDAKNGEKGEGGGEDEEAGDKASTDPDHMNQNAQPKAFPTLPLDQQRAKNAKPLVTEDSRRTRHWFITQLHAMLHTESPVFWHALFKELIAVARVSEH
jgi:hypothetical protein